MVSITKIAELTGHSSAVYALEESESGNCFYSGSGDKVVAKWNLDTLRQDNFSAQLPGIIYTLCLLKDKNILLVGTSEGKIHVIDLDEKKEIKTLQNHNQAVFDVQYSPQHKFILSAGGDGVLSVISAEDFRTLKLFKLCGEKLRAVDITNELAAIACGDGFIRMIDLNELKLINEFPAHTGSVYSVKFSPDGKHLLSGGKDAHLKIWKMEDGQWMMDQSIPAHNFAIYSIVFSPDGKYFATASRDKTIKVWDSGSFEILTRINKENFEGHIHSVNKLFWSKNLISVSDDKKIMVWNVK